MASFAIKSYSIHSALFKQIDIFQREKSDIDQHINEPIKCWITSKMPEQQVNVPAVASNIELRAIFFTVLFSEEKKKS